MINLNPSDIFLINNTICINRNKDARGYMIYKVRKGLEASFTYDILVGYTNSSIINLYDYNINASNYDFYVCAVNKANKICYPLFNTI